MSNLDVARQTVDRSRASMLPRYMRREVEAARAAEAEEAAEQEKAAAAMRKSNEPLVDMRSYSRESSVVDREIQVRAWRP